jgi:hypothetical protein
LDQFKYSILEAGMVDDDVPIVYAFFHHAIAGYMEGQEVIGPVGGLGGVVPVPLLPLRGGEPAVFVW